MMCRKDATYGARRNPLISHPELSTRARAILIDWLMDVRVDGVILSQVAAVEHLHRETFHLAVDYVDRYLASFLFGAKESDVRLQRLQMIGTTALHIASKNEVGYVRFLTCAGDLSALTRKIGRVYGWCMHGKAGARLRSDDARRIVVPSQPCNRSTVAHFLYATSRQPRGS